MVNFFVELTQKNEVDTKRITSTIRKSARETGRTKLDLSRWVQQMAVRKLLLCKILLKTSPTAPRNFSNVFNIFVIYFDCLIQQASQLSPLPTPQSFFDAKKKSRSDFFWASTVTRHSSLGRIDRPAHVTAVAASHTSKTFFVKKSRGAIFFGVHRYASQLSPLPTPKKKNTPKKSGSDFFLASSTTRHSSLGRIDRKCFRCFFVFFRENQIVSFLRVLRFI
jgi:hypothetical protein